MISYDVPVVVKMHIIHHNRIVIFRIASVIEFVELYIFCGFSKSGKDIIRIASLSNLGPTCCCTKMIVMKMRGDEIVHILTMRIDPEAIIGDMLSRMIFAVRHSRKKFRLFPLRIIRPHIT